MHLKIVEQGKRLHTWRIPLDKIFIRTSIGLKFNFLKEILQEKRPYNQGIEALNF
jgi:hypothetical protein